MELQAIIITGILTGILTTIVVTEFYKWRERRNVNKSPITGTWIGTLHKEYPDVITIDIAKCKHNIKTNQVSGRINRTQPIEENFKEWEFSGKFIDGVIYITFWSITDQTSDGAIIMSFNKEKKAFFGQYMKYKDTSTDGHSPTKQLVATDIDWKFERKTLKNKRLG